MSHNIDEFFCTQCQELHKDIPVKEIFPPNERHDLPIGTFDCPNPNCKTRYSATLTIVNIMPEGASVAEHPVVQVTITPHEPHSEA